MTQCNCGNEAKALVVKKEGQNKGRTFYACAKPKGEQCDFFEWGTGNAPASHQYSLQDHETRIKALEAFMTNGKTDNPLL